MDTLYHYCSTATFFSILENRSIWLSSVTQSNDYLEGKIVSQVIERLAEQDGLKEEQREFFRPSLRMMEDVFDGLAFCLSENGDLLSQWRGYAQNGTGVAIGFRRNYLELLAKASGSWSTLDKVIYDDDGQNRVLKPTYRKVKRLIKSGDMQKIREAHLTSGEKDKVVELGFLALPLLKPLYLLKSPAFSEEKEWRLLSHWTRDAQHDNCKYRIRNDEVVPYRTLEFNLKGSPITQVVLGPRHRSPEKVIEALLAWRGFPGVDVWRSSASYRA